MSTLGLWAMLTRRGRSSGLTTLLAIVAFAASTGALLLTGGGLWAFYQRDPNSPYTVLAMIACIIMVVPILTLGASASRLCIASRNQRLARLRLAGATTTQVGVLTVVDATIEALLGAVAGVGVYLAAIGPISLIPFEGRHFAWTGLLLPWWGIAGGVALVSVLGCLTAVASLAGVAITPLGVANRVSPRKLSWIRLVVAGFALVGYSAATEQPGLSIILTMLLVAIAVLNLVGPWLLGVIGRAASRRARSFGALMAARRLADDPKAAWRSVAGLGFATYVAAMVSIVPSMGAGNPDPADHLAADLMTGAFLTLGITAVIAAVSTAVSQSAKVLDATPQYRALALAGTDVRQLKRARVREAMLPLAWSMGLALVMAGVVIAPFGLTNPVSTMGGVLMLGGMLALCVGLVLAAVQVSQPLVDKVTVAA